MVFSLYGPATSDVAQTAAETGDQAKSMVETFGPLAIEYGLKIIGVLFAITVAFRLANWLQGKVTAVLKKRKFDEALSLFFGSLSKWLTIVAAVIACLGYFGFDTTSFAAVLGAAGLAIGLAFQGTLSNFAAGVMLLTFRPFTVGDFVNVSGVSGTVREIGLFTVTIDTLDNRRIVVPNAKVTEGIIENVTANDYRRVDIDVGVSYDANLNEARTALDEAAKAMELRDDERGHQVFLKGLGDSSVDFQVRVWCKAEDYWTVWDLLVQEIKEKLDGADVGIPFPQLDLHVQDMPKAS